VDGPPLMLDTAESGNVRTGCMAVAPCGISGLALMTYLRVVFVVGFPNESAERCKTSPLATCGRVPLSSVTPDPRVSPSRWDGFVV
jgi:hypothetical protein